MEIDIKDWATRIGNHTTSLILEDSSKFISAIKEAEDEAEKQGVDPVFNCSIGVKTDIESGNVDMVLKYQVPHRLNATFCMPKLPDPNQLELPKE